MEIATYKQQSVAVHVTESSEVGFARRTALSLGSEFSLSQTDRDAVALIVTELATNLAKYAQSGQLILRALTDGETAGMEIISVDKGPGFEDISKRIEDGYSSGGTFGVGLGAVRRLSDTFDIYSLPGAGTAVVSRVFKQGLVLCRPVDLFNFGVISVPLKGEDRCGDSWAVHQQENRTLFMVVDGLGHGVGAAEAAAAAVEQFNLNKDATPVRILESAHAALRSTRGGVMAVIDISSEGAVIYSGIGNISGVITDGVSTQHLISHNGTLGLAARPRQFTHTFNDTHVIILASDGLSNRWVLDKFPRLMSKDPSIIAAFLYQYYGRSNDDVTVFVARKK